MLDLLLFFAASALTAIAGITLSNMAFFPRLKRLDAPLPHTPRVSVMIPARNESAVIAGTLHSLLSQNDYPNFELLLLDDQSEDGTGDIARGLGDPRLRVLNGQPLPEGWAGKNWACHQMAQQAEGDILLFTDADVRWEPGALSALIAAMQRSNSDLHTVWPTQHTFTWAERLVVPNMALVVVGYLPIIGTHYVPLGAFGAANGQCMAWKRSAYQQIGGHAVVADNVLEDVTLARMVKGRGMRLRMADGGGLIGCRMYDGWPQVRDGYAKNILAGYGSAPALIAAAIFHWVIFLLPWVVLLLSLFSADYAQYRLGAAALVMLGLTLRMLTAAFTRQRVLDGLLMPLSVLLLTRIAWRSLMWHYTGGPSWKGRQIKRRTKHTKGTPPWNTAHDKSSS